MNLALFLAAALAWALLPLLPALRELLRPTDLEPLSVVGRDAGDVAFFARRFREYLLSQLSWTAEGQDLLPDGTPLFHLGGGNPPAGAEDRVVVAASGAALPEGTLWLREVYGAGDLAAGAGVSCRAVLAEGDLRLGPGTRVFRWAHAGGRLEAGPGAELYGRASSATAVRLGPGATFERLGAPCIEAGEPTPRPPARAEEVPRPWAPPGGAVRVGDHWRVRGPLRIPPSSRVEGSLVATGSLEIGERSVVVGSLKAHGRLVVRTGARVEGSVVARKDLEIGARCTILGPVLAEGDVSIAGGTEIGELGRPTTVNGRRVELEIGAVVYGLVNTQDGGAVGRGAAGGGA